MIGQNVLYQCTKFERNPSRRIFFLGSKLLLLIDVKKKNVKKIGQFSEMHISQATYPIFFKFSSLLFRFDRNPSSSQLWRYEVLKTVCATRVSWPLTHNRVCLQKNLYAPNLVCQGCPKWQTIQLWCAVHTFSDAFELVCYHHFLCGQLPHFVWCAIQILHCILPHFFHKYMASY